MREFKGLEGFSKDTFWQMLEDRKNKIDEASGESLPQSYAVNELAKRLHPTRHYMKIAKVTELLPDTKLYRFVPDPARGTTECAYFKAGKYIDIHLTVNDMHVSRAYSIASSPKEALEGFYEIAIKAAEGGLVSNYVLENWKEGDEVVLSEPSGFFDYQSIRDAHTVIALAGGSGITPFLSMAKAVADGTEDFNLVLLYGSKTEEEILFRDEFDALEKACDKIKVVHVLSNEEKDGFEHGFITSDLVKKYAPADEPYSVFVCGPQAMYDFLDVELEKLELPRKFVRKELYGEVHNAASMKDYPGTDLSTVKITISVQDETKTVTGDANDTVMQTLEKHGITMPASCRSGECGFCHSKLVSGEIFVPARVDGRRMGDKKFGFFHPCVAFPLSDLVIEVPVEKIK